MLLDCNLENYNLRESSLPQTLYRVERNCFEPSGLCDIAN